MLNINNFSTTRPILGVTPWDKVQEPDILKSFSSYMVRIDFQQFCNYVCYCKLLQILSLTYTLANIQGQVPWPMFSIRHLCQCPFNNAQCTLSDFQHHVPWPMSRARSFDLYYCSSLVPIFQYQCPVSTPRANVYVQSQVFQSILMSKFRFLCHNQYPASVSKLPRANVQYQNF